ncbi:LppM family (lipo)protein [Glycomyces tenuis]|uniref:LppM family (lipo)protein n=1 Tax=Glycomyces tenuis TaxID=58116 RepID=UPI0004236715|nr:hypothetical protein [Glycomyces tenuis]
MLGLTKPAALRALSAVAALAVLFAAAGCLRLDLELEVRSDDTVGGTFTAAWSEEFLADVRAGEGAIEQAELDAFLEALLEGVPGAERRDYREGGYVGRTASFTDRPLSEFAELGGDEWGFLRIEHDGRRYVLDGHWDLRATGFLMTEDFAEAEVIISVNFPADVTDHNGELEGRTVTWRMSPGEEYELHAEAEQHNAWLWIGVAAAAFALVLALVWLWQWSRLRRHSTGER